MRLAATVATAVVVVLAGTIPAVANVGGNDYRDCTRHEYRAAKRGMSLDRVQRMLDGRGHVESDYRIGGHHYQSRQWGNYQTGHSRCFIDFKDGHLNGKYFSS